MAKDEVLARWSVHPTGRTWAYFCAYVGVSAAVVALAAARQQAANRAALRAGEVLHAAALRAVLASPLAWFEANPSGRVAGRFAKDVQACRRARGFRDFGFSGFSGFSG